MPRLEKNIQGSDAVQLIKELGGITATAKKSDVATSSVCYWIRHGIPLERERILRAQFSNLLFGKSLITRSYAKLANREVRYGYTL